MSIVHSWVSIHERNLVIGGSPGRGSFQPPRQTRPSGAAVQAGMLRPGGSTPCVSSIAVTNSRKTTGPPSVTK